MIPRCGDFLHSHPIFSQRPRLIGTDNLRTPHCFYRMKLSNQSAPLYQFWTRQGLMLSSLLRAALPVIAANCQRNPGQEHIENRLAPNNARHRGRWHKSAGNQYRCIFPKEPQFFLQRRAFCFNGIQHTGNLPHLRCHAGTGTQPPFPALFVIVVPI